MGPSSPLSGSLGTCPGKEPSDAAQPWEAGPTDKMEAFYRQGHQNSEVKKTAQEHAAAKCLQSGFSFRKDPEASHTRSARSYYTVIKHFLKSSDSK